VHILFLSDNFPPEVNAPASRTFEHCREWVRTGHQVTVLTCVPNFPQGKVYKGYRNRIWQSEMTSGIRTVRVWSFITANEGFLPRTFDYVSYMVSAIAAAPFLRGADIVVATSPQFFTAIAGYIVSRMKRIPFVFELRDLWPESIKAVGAMQNGFLLKTLESLEMFLYRKADLIVPNTHSFKEILQKRGIDGAKIHVVTNGVDLTRFSPMRKDAGLAARYGLEGKFVAGYIGTVGMAHALDTLLEAAANLEAFANRGRFHLILLGDGAQKQELQAKARSMQLSNVTFIDSVPKSEVVRYWSLLDVSINHLRRTELFTNVIPSKMFEAMAMGIPILHGVRGESARIVETEGVGLLFEPENAAELTEAILRLESDRACYDTLKKACLSAAPRYDRTILAHKMLALLQDVGLKAKLK
jgi:glycosyltransferase involved in cell wall biosynthesis